MVKILGFAPQLLAKHDLLVHLGLLGIEFRNLARWGVLLQVRLVHANHLKQLKQSCTVILGNYKVKICFINFGFDVLRCVFRHYNSARYPGPIGVLDKTHMVGYFSFTEVTCVFFVALWVLRTLFTLRYRIFSLFMAKSLD